MVNTFCVDSDVRVCAASLDNKRLGKQRVEALQIYKALTGQTKGWRHHPATKMWAGYEPALAVYHNAMIAEWKSRGFKNTMELLPVDDMRPVFPPWFGWEPLMWSHRASLQRKDPERYRHFDFPSEYLQHGYVWPSKLDPVIFCHPLHGCCPKDVCVPISPPSQRAKTIKILS